MSGYKEPKYEIWGFEADEEVSISLRGHFRDEYETYEEANTAVHAWRTELRAAWIVDKETGLPC